MQHILLTRTIAVLFVLIYFSARSTAQGVTITTGANLVINGNANLVINDGGLNNSGVFTSGTGTVTFSGTASSLITTLGGTSSLNFYNLSINKSSGSAKLTRNISVSNNVLLQMGSLDLSTFDLDLGSTGNISGESASAFITGLSGGSVLKTVNLNAPNAVNVGNMGIEITSAANLGLTTIKRGHMQQVSSSGYGIYRYYDIIPANNTSLNATVKFNYRDQELGSINENELKLWSSANNGSTWNLLGADALDASANFVLKNGIGQLNRLTLASSVNNPLPVNLVSFTGQIAGNNIILNWSTSLELNNSHFEVEKSVDGRNFSVFATVRSSGNALGGNYQSTDANAFGSGNAVYYRIKQVDVDGKHTYTKVIYFTKGTITNSFIGVYPNPSNGPLQLRFISNGAVKATILQILDVSGKTVASARLNVQAGLNDIPFDVSGLSQGTYMIKLSGFDFKTITIIKR